MFASYLMSLAVFSLAVALVYVACQRSRVSTRLPGILTSVGETSGKVEPIIEETLDNPSQVDSST